MAKNTSRLRVASKHGVHEANGWFAIVALVLIFVIPPVAGIICWLG